MKKIIQLLIVMLLLTNVSYMQLYATSNTYYVTLTSGNDGFDGSKDKPFASINKALEVVKDGDIIEIVDKAIAFDSENNDEPLIIDKAITIQGNANTLSSLDLRCGGFILGNDVTFKHLTIGTAGFLYPGIASNGHHLTLINIHQEASLRPLQIYGGTFYDQNGIDLGANNVGSKSMIDIYGGNYDAIYTGSINGSFNQDVIVKVKKAIDEQQYNFSINQGIFVASTSKDASDINSAGQIPSLNDEIKLNNQNQIMIYDNVNIKKIDGVNDEHSLSLLTSGIGTYLFQVNKIDELKVLDGNFMYQGTFNPCDIELVGSASNKATLDLSALSNQNIHVNNFIGSEYGILTLPKTSDLIIEESLKGISEFRVDGGMPWHSDEIVGYSGYMEVGTTYIILNGKNHNGGFEIKNPYSTQENIFLQVKDNQKWIVSEEAEYGICEVLSLAMKDQVIEYEASNHDLLVMLKANVDVVFSEETMALYNDYLSYVDLKYQITYIDEDGNETRYPQQISLEDINVAGNYICNYQLDTNESIYFEPISNYDSDIAIHSIYFQPNNLKNGTYMIEVATHSLKTSFKLIVYGNTSMNKTTLNVSISDEIYYGDQLLIDGNISGVNDGELVVMINGTNKEIPFSKGLFKEQLDVNINNGFIIGDNKVSIKYLGNDENQACNKDFTIVVIKGTIDVEVVCDQEVTSMYDGDTYEYNIDQIKVYHNDQLLEDSFDYQLRYRQDVQMVDEIRNVGSYDVYLQVLESDYYMASDLIKVATINMIPKASELQFSYQSIRYDESLKQEVKITVENEAQIEGTYQIYDVNKNIVYAQGKIQEDIIFKTNEMIDYDNIVIDFIPSSHNYTSLLKQEIKDGYYLDVDGEVLINGIKMNKAYVALNQDVSISLIDTTNFKKWEISSIFNDLDVKQTTLKFKMIDEDIYLKAIYEDIEYVNIEADSNKHISVSGLGSYKVGHIVTLKASVKDGYDFLGYYLDDELVCKDPTYTFEARKDVKLQVKDQLLFEDVKKTAWYYQSVEQAFDLGLMKNTGKGKTFFEPNTNITRGMVATILYRMANNPPTIFKIKFTDVKDESLWYANAICWASEYGVVNGYQDGSFKPDTFITRQDLAIMIRNYAKVKGISTSVTIDFSSYQDGNHVDDYAASALAFCIQNKIISGSKQTDGIYLKPKANATRSECAKMFVLLAKLDQ